MKKSERLQAIIMVLQQNVRMTARELADYFEVSLRTIYRDIDALSQMNIPIIAYEGLHGGYEIDPSYFVPTIRLTDKEIFVLMLLLKVSKQLNMPDFSEQIKLLNLKLINACQGLSNHYVATLKKVSFDIQYIYSKGHLPGVFEDILGALNRNVKLDIKYYVPIKNNLVKRVISPMHLFYSEGCWYLDAFCHLRRQKRTFRLDRIKACDLLTELIDTDILHRYNNNILEDPRFLLELEIEQNLFSLIKDDSAMQGAEIVSNKDNKYNVIIETNKNAYFETLAIRNIKEVTIKKPEFLIEQVKEKILAGIKKYN